MLFGKQSCSSPAAFPWQPAQRQSSTGWTTATQRSEKCSNHGPGWEWVLLLPAPGARVLLCEKGKATALLPTESGGVSMELGETARGLEAFR